MAFKKKAAPEAAPGKKMPPWLLPKKGKAVPKKKGK